MRVAFIGIAFVLLITGFYLPGAWIFAIISGILAIFTRPAGTWADRKQRGQDKK
jgi:hypothetical protein